MSDRMDREAHSRCKVYDFERLSERIWELKEEIKCFRSLSDEELQRAELRIAKKIEEIEARIALLEHGIEQIEIRISRR